MKKILLCVDLTDYSIDTYKKKFEKYDWSKVSELHLVHGFKTQTYVDTFTYSTYPLESEYGPIEKSVKELLDSLGEKLTVGAKDLNIRSTCLIGTSPKELIRQYAMDYRIDEMIVSTRGTHGVESLFTSSFAEFMVRFAPCDLKIIRG